MFTIIGYIIVGLIGGAISKAIVPGESPAYGSWFSTMLLGIGGALLGGFLGGSLFNVSYTKIFSLGGIAFSALGASLLLVLQGWLVKKK